jgi:hypothetical protein
MRAVPSEGLSEIDISPLAAFPQANGKATVWGVSSRDPLVTSVKWSDGFIRGVKLREGGGIAVGYA